MLDIHCHILPDADDGSGSMQDSIEMAEIAVASGVSGIVVTPHTNRFAGQKNLWSAEMEESLRALQRRFAEKELPLTLYPGQEIFLFGEYLSALRRGELIGLNRSRYLLVEFPLEERAQDAYRKLEQLCAEGIVPVVAHPERYGFVLEDEAATAKMRAIGCLLQVNKDSLQSHAHRACRMAAHTILKRRMAACIASDAHSQYRRTPNLAEIHETISEQYSYEYAELLLEINPARMIANRDSIHAQ